MKLTSLLLGVLLFALSLIQASCEVDSDADDEYGDDGWSEGDARDCAYESRTITICVDSGNETGDWKPGCHENADSCDSGDYEDYYDTFDGCSMRVTYRNVHWVSSCNDWEGGDGDDDEGDDDNAECDEGETECVSGYDSILGETWDLKTCSDGKWITAGCGYYCASDDYAKNTDCGYDSSLGRDICYCSMCRDRYRCSEKEKYMNDITEFKYQYLVEECDDLTGEWTVIQDCSSLSDGYGFDCSCTDWSTFSESYATCQFADSVCEGKEYHHEW